MYFPRDKQTVHTNKQRQTTNKQRNVTATNIHITRFYSLLFTSTTHHGFPANSPKPERP